MADKICPVCNSVLIKTCLYWCSNCEKWFEEIDFLDSSEEIDEDCKKCSFLAETKFKKNDIFLHYCNNLESDRPTEKIRDFRKCDKIRYKQGL